MRDLYSDDYESVAGDGADRLIPTACAGSPARRSSSAWSRRWASGPTGSAPATPAEVPIIRAMEGPARVEPADPGGAAGGAPGPRGQRRARRASRRRCRATPAPAAARAGGAGGGGRAAGRAGAGGAGGAGRAGARRGRRPADAAGRGAADELAALERGRRSAGGRRRRRSMPPETCRAAVAEAAPAQPAGEPRGRARQAQAGRRCARSRRGGEGRGAGRGAEGRAAATPRWLGLAPGTRLVQLGAFDSEEITRKAWAQLVAPQRRPARRRRASTSSAPPPTRGCSTGCGSRASPTPSRRGRCARRCGRAASTASR